jgi:hypothetical protein
MVIKIIKIVFCFFVIFFSIIFAQSSVPSYQIVYSPSSSYKTVPLNNAAITIKSFLGGNPQGISVVTTDNAGNFSLAKNYPVAVTIRVMSINNEQKYGVRCCGVSSPGNNIIPIVCAKIQQFSGATCSH